MSKKSRNKKSKAFEMVDTGLRTAKAEVGNGVKVVFDAQVWDDLWGWCKAGKSEVSGMFRCERMPDGTFFADKIWLPPQKGSSAFTELTTDGRTQMVLEAMKLNKAGSPKKIWGWWHTHYNFDPFWSVTDVQNINTLLAGGCQWLVSIVVSQKETYECRVDTTFPFRVGVEHIPVELNDAKHKFDKKRYEKDIAKAVQLQTYVQGALTEYMESPHGNVIGFKPGQSNRQWYENQGGHQPSWEAEYEKELEAEYAKGRPSKRTGPIWPTGEKARNGKPSALADVDKIRQKIENDEPIAMGTKYVYWRKELMTLEKYNKLKGAEDLKVNMMMLGESRNGIDYGD